MRFRQGGAQTILIPWEEDQVDVIVHQAPAEAGNAGFAAGLREKLQIERAILIREKDRKPAIAALGDMMRNMRENDAGESGHLGGLAERKRLV
jgi:hypothetical protein